MPDKFAKPEEDEARIRGRTLEIKSSCMEVMERIFDQSEAKEQAYSLALSALNLSKRYGKDRLEVACAHALPK